MPAKQPNDCWECVSQIRAAEAKVVVAHSGGTLVAEFVYSGGSPTFLIHLRSHAADSEAGSHYVFPIGVLPLLLEHIAAVLISVEGENKKNGSASG